MRDRNVASLLREWEMWDDGWMRGRSVVRSCVVVYPNGHGLHSLSVIFLISMTLQQKYNFHNVLFQLYAVSSQDFESLTQ